MRFSLSLKDTIFGAVLLASIVVGYHAYAQLSQEFEQAKFHINQLYQAFPR